MPRTAEGESRLVSVRATRAAPCPRRAFSGVAPDAHADPSQAPPRSPTDAHPVSPGERRSPMTIAERSHPHSHPNPNPLPFPPPQPSRGHLLTPPPPTAATAAASAPQTDCAAPCCSPTGTAAQPPAHMRRTASMYHPSEHAPHAAASMTAGRPAPGAPSSSSAFSGPGRVPHVSARSIWNPADELVSVVTSGRAPFAQHPPPHVSRRHTLGLERVASSSGTESARPGLVAGPSTGMNSRPTDQHLSSARNAGRAGPSSLAASPTSGSYFPHAPSASRYPANPPSSGRGKGRHIEDPAQYNMSNNTRARDVRAGSASAAGPARAKASPATDDSERRHCCPHCNKRFNRPSSLAIHVNTHTGAKRTFLHAIGLSRAFVG
ncbi:hypothetical protein PYCCODRAFT_456369 [Trametes coccinea BRFM310]|uniref:C2H2-type domain-containing protein n=1 Tax=Trametes coccinea (strain BRFM310) TaxID=1353009 RepID=A0A1Y2IPL1_TRAC3|nr:hypothetical protein PYCCODRAFT_456369 [Trametes coccinea BRFM310]